VTGVSDAAARAGAILTVDLGAIVANWRILLGKLKPGARAAAVVKADAYGLGMAHVAPALAAAGCTRFCVANLDEGIALRAVLPETKFSGPEILVFSGPFAGTEDDYVAHRLIPVLNSPEQIERWGNAARAANLSLAAAIHVDTGLSRLGLPEAGLRELAQDREARAAIDIVLVMSHLAVAEQPDHPLIHAQRERFAHAAALLPGVPTSLAASSGIFLGADWQGDWVRPGAALYGVNPIPSRPNPLAQVVQLQGKIVQVRHIDAGQTVGYGATWRAARATRVAIVAAGYADGLPRALSNRGSAFLGEHRVPLVGRVSMDLMAFDVGALPESAAREGAVMTLIGGANTVDAVGESAGTNGYEILTSLGQRYHRVWTGSGSAGNEKNPA
jgi:alanine racemase